MKKVYMGLLTGLIFLCAVNLTFAAQIDVFGTGVDDSGNLTGVGTADTHYSLIGPGNSAATAISAGDGHGNWVDPISDGKSAQWITPGGGFGAVVNGTWVYSIAFDLSGLDPATAIIDGIWASDNGSTIYLNNSNTGYATPMYPSADSFENYYSFSLTSGFIEGINTLSFDVDNATSSSSPSGLFVDIENASAVPEPSTFLLLGGGLLGLGWYGRKRKKA